MCEEYLEYDQLQVTKGVNIYVLLKKEIFVHTFLRTELKV